MRGKKESRQINNIKKEKKETVTKTLKILMILIDYYEQLYANNFENLEIMKNLLKTFNLLKLTSEKRENLSSIIIIKEIESMI